MAEGEKSVVKEEKSKSSLKKLGLQAKWEKILDEAGMPDKLTKSDKEIDMSTMAAFGKDNRPKDYDPQNDLYIGDTPELTHEDASQCDGRIGVNGARKNPEKFNQFLEKEKKRKKTA
jgi:chemotaxis regulatin CheY-phosphate phosphatase CheZ